jgi:HPt (histidine-containing phosphotransfer) domain-containing protein
MSETTIWQPDAMETLRDQLGDEDGILVREIIQLYLVQARDLLAQMEVAARQADDYQLRGLAHSLKESTATVGGGRLAAACDQIEHASPAELGSPEVWPCVQREFELLAAELERYRPLRGAGSPGWGPGMTRGGRSAGSFLA